jgi:hypothetical protein
MTRNFFYIAVFIILGFNVALAQDQTLPAPASTPASLETILAEAEKQALFYQETFKNLLADEKKTFERFNKNGEVRQQTVVESILLIYQSPKDQNVSTELRNVLRVDGKNLPDSQRRSDLLFAELQKTSTVEKELEKIQNESLRYDKTLEINGLTVSEALVLSEKLRPFFDFTPAGTENFEGREVYVVNYRQTRKSPYISADAKRQTADALSFNLTGFDIPKNLRNSDVLMRGKLWIDAQTFQIWREEREVTVGAPNPVVLLATTLEYQPSEYEILVPKRISLTANELRRNSKANQYTAVNDTRVTFDYSKFRKTETDVKIIEDEP